MKHVCSSLINFIVSNGSRTEKSMLTEKRKYDRSLLAISLRKRTSSIIKVMGINSIFNF
jgi:hypothetical protein